MKDPMYIVYLVWTFLSLLILMALIPGTLTLLYELLKMYQMDYLNLEVYWSIIIFLAVTMECG